MLGIKTIFLKLFNRTTSVSWTVIPDYPPKSLIIFLSHDDFESMANEKGINSALLLEALIAKGHLVETVTRDRQKGFMTHKNIRKVIEKSQIIYDQDIKS